MDKNITEFLETQTEKIKPLFKKTNNSYWEASITGKKEDYEKYELCQKEMAKFFNNIENFNKIKEFINLKVDNQLIKRQLQILYNSYLNNQGDINLINKIVEKSTQIEERFNTFRAKINGKEFTDNQIKEILEKETNSEKLQEAWEASKLQGELIKEDLIELIKLRNQLARNLGFKNYYTFSLEVNEQKEEEITKILEKLEKSTDLIFKEVKSQIDEFLYKKYNVSELKPWHYQDLFFQKIPKIYNINLDKFYTEDLLKKAEIFYASIGLEVSDIIKRSDLFEKPGKYQHAYCMDLDREGDIRSVMNIKNNEYWMGTILHELGHGIYWEYINKELPFLIRDTSHILTTEAIAQLFERNSKNIHFIKKFGDNKLDETKNIKDEISKSLKYEKLVFSRWSQVMFHFEKSLYENPEQNLNNLWWELVNRYQLIDFCRDKADWASKIHLVSSPVYYHNYILGELFASQINHYISKKILDRESLKDIDYYGKEEIGDYLKSKIFFPGAIYKWNELIKYSTDEELNPKYWIEEFS